MSSIRWQRHRMLNLRARAADHSPGMRSPLWIILRFRGWRRIILISRDEEFWPTFYSLPLKRGLYQRREQNSLVGLEMSVLFCSLRPSFQEQNLANNTLCPWCGEEKEKWRSHFSTRGCRVPTLLLLPFNGRRRHAYKLWLFHWSPLPCFLSLTISIAATSTSNAPRTGAVP